MKPSLLHSSSFILSLLRHTLIACALLCGMHVWGEEIILDFNQATNVYGLATVADKSGEFTSEGVTYAYDKCRYFKNTTKPVDYNLFIQKKNAGVAGYIYNTTPIPGKITKITLTYGGATSESSKLYVNVGDSPIATQQTAGQDVLSSKKNTAVSTTATLDGRYFNLTAVNTNNIQVGKIVITYTPVDVPKHDITWYIGDEEPYTTEVSEGGIPEPTTMPTTYECNGVTKQFVGWSTVPITTESAKPTIGYYEVLESVSADSPKAFYAVFATASSGGTTTVNFVAETDMGYSVDTECATFEKEGVTFVPTGSGNTSKYFTSDKTWRVYKTKTLTITAPNTIRSVSSNASVTFKISNNKATASITATTRFKNITIEYDGGAIYSNYLTSCGCTLPTPINLVSTPSETSAILTWDPVAGATGYIVSELSEEDDAVIKTYPMVTDPTITLTDLTPNTDYIWGVVATDGTDACNSAQATDFFTTQSADPYVTITPSTFEPFYAYGDQPSAAQMFVVSAKNLVPANGLMILVQNFEITQQADALDPTKPAVDAVWTTSISGGLEHTDGTIAPTSIFVRLPAGQPIGSILKGELYVMHHGQMMQTLSLRGEVYTADDEMTVTFMDGENVVHTMNDITSGNTIAAPTLSLGCQDYVFQGWSTSKIADTETEPTYFDFTTPITQNTILYAVYKHVEKEAHETKVVYELVTDVAKLAEAKDKKVIITNADHTQALSTTQDNNNRGQADITTNGTIIETLNDDVQVLTLENGTTTDTYAFHTGEKGYLYAASSSSNHLKTSTQTSGNSSWKINITTAGVATIKAQGSNTRNWMRYNSSGLFSCYGSGQQDVSIFRARKADKTTYTLMADCHAEISATAVKPITSAKGIEAQSLEGTITVIQANTTPTNLSPAFTGDDVAMFSATVSAWTQTDEDTYTATYRITYKPTESGHATHTASLTFSAICNGETRTTDAVSVKGYALPDQFVIATLKDDEWVALPGNMTAASNPEPISVLVDDASHATLGNSVADPSMVYKLRKRHGGSTSSQPDALRFQNVSTTECLWASATANTIKNDSKDGASPDANYEWIMQTDDGLNYYLYNTQRDRSLGIYDNKWGMYDSKVLVRFFAYSTIEVAQWEADGVTLNLATYDPTYTITVEKEAPKGVFSVAYTGTISSLANGKVVIGDPDDAADPKLTDLPCRHLKVTIKDAANKLVNTSTLRIPIFVTTSQYTDNDAFTALKKVHGATDAQSVTICKTCDVVVEEDVVLTHNTKSRYNQFHNLYINAGAKLAVNNGTLKANSLILRSENDLVPQVVCNDADDFTLSGSLHFTKRITDDSRYYFFSLPYDCNINDIRFADGTPCKLDDNLAILYYDGNKRLSNGGKESNWVALAAGSTLQAGQGYAVGVTGNKEVVFPMQPTTANIQADEADTKEIAVTAHGINDGHAPNNVGWNFVGNPYLSTYQAGSETGDATLLTGSLHLKDNGEYEVQNESTLYLTIPDTGTDQTYHQVLASTNAVSPFSAFFIQASATGSLIYAPEQVNPMLLAAHSPQPTNHNPQPIYAGISLTSGTKTDETSLAISNRFTQAYEIGSDLEKMLGLADKPQVYIQDDAYRYAFKALNEQDAATVNPLGVYLPAQEATTYTFNAMRTYDLSRVQAIYLTDHVAAKTVNLLDAPYSFTHTQEHNTTHFALSVVLKPEIVTSLTDITTTWTAWQDAPLHITLQGLTIGDDIRVVDAAGRLIYQFPATDATMQCYLPTAGVYCIQTIGTNGLQLKKIIIR